MKIITKELSSRFYYDITSPSCLRWAEDIVARNKLNRKVGDIAGYIANNGYYRVSSNCSIYTVHRIIYFMNYPDFDQDMEVDHINQNKLDNRIENLRCVSREVNTRNHPLRKDNSSGLVGVAKRKLSGVEYWVGFYNENGKQIAKYFSTKKFGEELAKQLAMEFRNTAILRIGNYSSLHGIDKKKKEKYNPKHPNKQE